MKTCGEGHPDAELLSPPVFRVWGRGSHRQGWRSFFRSGFSFRFRFRVRCFQFAFRLFCFVFAFRFVSFCFVVCRKDVVVSVVFACVSCVRVLRAPRPWSWRHGRRGTGVGGCLACLNLLVGCGRRLWRVLCSRCGAIGGRHRGCPRGHPPSVRYPTQARRGLRIFRLLFAVFVFGFGSSFLGVVAVGCWWSMSCAHGSGVGWWGGVSGSLLGGGWLGWCWCLTVDPGLGL